jgi:nitroreductase/NAD-dependent dihydropyrimidine dehydrogenase PreA subunit
MPKIIVNTELCTKCYQCAHTCLMGIIRPSHDSAFPTIDAANEDNCLRCGHCEAFCPEQALVLDFLKEERKHLTPGANQIKPDNLSLYMQSRRSIRHFKSDLVSRETIARILEVARYAPTGGNSQTVQWLVIYDPKEVKRIASLTVDWMRSILGSSHPLAHYVPNIIRGWEMGYDPICRHAPHLVFAHIPSSEFVDDRTDAINAISHFDLAAPAFGIGACWAGFIRMALDSYPPLQEALALPSNRKIGYGLFFGYPLHQITAIPRRNPVTVEWR